MNEQNFVGDTQDSTDDIQYQAYVALVEDFKELIDTTVKAGKDSYKHVDWCCTIKVDIENSKGQYIEKDKQEATKDGSESTKIQHGI